MVDPLCPTCHSKISPTGKRIKDSNSPGIPAWSNDPMLTPSGLNGPTYIGVHLPSAIDIIEIQNVRKQQEQDLGITPPTEFSSINIGTTIPQVTHITELRISTERILDASGVTLQDYFKTDIDGNIQPAGPQDIQDKTDWTDVSRGIAIKNTGINTSILSVGNTKFKLNSITTKNVPTIPSIPLKGIHIEDLRHPLVTQWIEQFKPELPPHIHLATNGLSTTFSTISPSIPITNETPSGIINGINTIFILSRHAITFPISLQVFINGNLQILDTDYTFDDVNTISFVIAPISGSVVTANYNTQYFKGDRTNYIQSLTLNPGALTNVASGDILGEDNIISGNPTHKITTSLSASSIPETSSQIISTITIHLAPAQENLIYRIPFNFYFDPSFNYVVLRTGMQRITRTTTYPIVIGLGGPVCDLLHGSTATVITDLGFIAPGFGPYTFSPNPDSTPGSDGNQEAAPDNGCIKIVNTYASYWTYQIGESTGASQLSVNGISISSNLFGNPSTPTVKLTDTSTLKITLSNLAYSGTDPDQDPNLPTSISFVLIANGHSSDPIILSQLAIGQNIFIIKDLYLTSFFDTINGTAVTFGFSLNGMVQFFERFGTEHHPTIPVDASDGEVFNTTETLDSLSASLNFTLDEVRITSV